MSNILRVIISDSHSDEEVQIVVPNTGTYTSEQIALKNQNYLNVGLIFLLIVTVLAITFVVASRILRTKRLKSFSVNKKTRIGCGILSFLMLLGLFVGGLVVKSMNVMAEEPDTLEASVLRDGDAPGGEEGSEKIPVTAEDVTIEIERTGEPVLAVGSATITVNESLEGDYALHISATRSSDLRLVGAESSSEKISSIVAYDVPLQLNTYGITMEQGTSYDDWRWDQVFVSPSSSGYFGHFRSPVSAGDKATVYFGVYIDDSLPAGIYETEVDYWLVKDGGTI